MVSAHSFREDWCSQGLPDHLEPALVSLHMSWQTRQNEELLKSNESEWGRLRWRGSFLAAPRASGPALGFSPQGSAYRYEFACKEEGLQGGL